jgi:hypothetical protein
MDMLKKLSPPAQVVLGGAVLYLIFSFFNWQQVCFGPACAGVSEWHGFGGTITALSAILLLAWEVVRVLNVKVDLRGVSQGLISLGLALLLLVLTVLTFLTHNEARHWPSYVGLLLAIVIAGAAFARGKDEGVQMSDFGSLAGSVSSRSSTTTSPSAPSVPATPTPPPAPEPPAGDSASGGDAPAA